MRWGKSHAGHNVHGVIVIVIVMVVIHTFRTPKHSRTPLFALYFSLTILLIIQDERNADNFPYPWCDNPFVCHCWKWQYFYACAVRVRILQYSQIFNVWCDIDDNDHGDDDEDDEKWRERGKIYYFSRMYLSYYWSGLWWLLTPN